MPLIHVMFSFNVNREVLQWREHNDSKTTDKISTSMKHVNCNRIANPFFWVMFSFNVNREVLQSGEHNDSNTTDKISTSMNR